MSGYPLVRPGQKVRLSRSFFKRKPFEEEAPWAYPPNGTSGVVRSVPEYADGCYVEWPHGTVDHCYPNGAVCRGDDIRFCPYKYLEVVE